MNNQFFTGKKILITGHTGFKGSWLTLLLLRLGAEVIGYSNAPLPGVSLYRLWGVRPHDEVFGDICDLGLLKETLRRHDIQFVIHLAGQSLVTLGIQNPYETFRTNGLGGATLLEAVRQTPSVQAVLYITTDKVYRNDGTNLRFAEESPLWATSPYAASKICSELIADTYSQSFFRKEHPCVLSVLRAGNVIGGGDFAPHRIIPDCVRAWAHGTQLRLRNPDSIRAYQHVLDVLAAYLEVLQMSVQQPELSGIYNVGPGEQGNFCTSQLAEMFYSFLGADPKSYVVCRNPNLAEDVCLSLNNEKLFKTLGFQPLWTLEKAVFETAKWYKVWAEGGDVERCCVEQINEYLEGKAKNHGCH